MGSAGGAAATYMLLKGKKKEEKMKWECVEVSHHKNVEEQLKNGKRVAGISIATLQLEIQEPSVITCFSCAANKRQYQ